VARFSGGAGGEGTPGPPGQDADTGDITFDGVKIIGAGTASGDGANLGTIELVPDGDLTSDQYIIIDPTAPNHIHIRAGGTQDASNADLIIGGEDTNLLVSDTGDYVDVRTTSETATNIWRFGSDGILSGPGMSTLYTYWITAPESSLKLSSSSDQVILNGATGEFLNDETDPANQIATIGDISNTVTAETSFTVNGGTLGDQPTFTGAPLFSGTYVKTGPMVHFQIQVDMDNITNFGTGQYFVELPFHAKYGYQLKNGCLHDISTGNQFAVGGHVAAGSNQLLLNYIGSNGQDEVFDHNSPVTLNVADNFHISGDYIYDTAD
jgi:hypothetical protein